MQPNVMLCYCCVSVHICLPICRCQSCPLQEFEVMVLLLAFCLQSPCYSTRVLAWWLLHCVKNLRRQKTGKQVNWQISLKFIWGSSIALSKYSFILLMKSSRWQSYSETVLVNPLHCHDKKFFLLAFLSSEIYKKRFNVPVRLLILTLLTALFMSIKTHFISKKEALFRDALAVITRLNMQ